MIKMTRVFPISMFLLAACAPAAFSQNATADDIKGLRGDIDADRDSQKLIKDQLDAIQKLIQQGGGGGAAPAPAGFQETTLSLEGAQIKGDKNAKVTMIEFTDFQCPFCG